jgi:hypothetical protein
MEIESSIIAVLSRTTEPIRCPLDIHPLHFHQRCLQRYGGWHSPVVASSLTSAVAQLQDYRFIVLKDGRLPPASLVQADWFNYAVYEYLSYPDGVFVYGRFRSIHKEAGLKSCPLSKMKSAVLSAMFKRDFFLCHRTDEVLFERNLITGEWFLPSINTCWAENSVSLPQMPFIRHVGPDSRIQDGSCPCYERAYVPVDALEEKIHSYFWAWKIAELVQQTAPAFQYRSLHDFI